MGGMALTALSGTDVRLHRPLQAHDTTVKRVACRLDHVAGLEGAPAVAPVVEQRLPGHSIFHDAAHLLEVGPACAACHSSQDFADVERVILPQGA